MSAKTLICAVLVWTAMTVASARAQYPSASTNPLDALPAPGTTPASSSNGVVVPTQGPAQLSRWLTYERPCECFGPVGGNGPLQTELFARTGPSWIVGGGVFDDTLRTGWAAEGGARLLLFDPDLLRAWTAQVSVFHVWNHGKNPNFKVPFTTLVPGPPDIFNQIPDPVEVRFGVDVPGLTIRSLNRTFATLGFGREWYLLGSAECGEPAWRIGFDFGGRYGMANLETHELRHRIDVIGGVWAALHSDVEIPCGCCMLYAGFRAEWAYTWSDILQSQNDADLQDVNLLLNLGVRF